jgi:hypothetical protein
VIPRFVRCHLTPSRRSDWRMVSILTRLSLRPCSKQTSAARERSTSWSFSHRRAAACAGVRATLRCCLLTLRLRHLWSARLLLQASQSDLSKCMGAIARGLRTVQVLSTNVVALPSAGGQWESVTRWVEVRGNPCSTLLTRPSLSSIWPTLCASSTLLSCCIVGPRVQAASWTPFGQRTLGHLVEV